MRRRQLLAGLAGLTGAGVFTLGSVAFGNAMVQRQVNVETTSDSQAVLRLVPGAFPAVPDRADIVDDTIRFQFPGDDEEDASLNVDARLQYATDTAGGTLFTISNDGTETVELTDAQVESGSDVPDVGVFDLGASKDDEGLRKLLREDPVVLDPGEGIEAGIEINAFGLEPDQSYDTEILLEASSP